MVLAFKFLHVLSAMVWIGGVFALVVLNARMAGSQNRAAMQAFAQQSALFGQAVIGPAAGLTLLAGISTAVLMGVSFGSLWIVWGFSGIFLSMLLGAVFIRQAAARFDQQMAGASAPEPAVLASLRRRLVNLNLLNLLLLVSVVAAMVFKPVI